MENGKWQMQGDERWKGSAIAGCLKSASASHTVLVTAVRANEIEIITKNQVNIYADWPARFCCLS